MTAHSSSSRAAQQEPEPGQRPQGCGETAHPGHLHPRREWPPGLLGRQDSALALTRLSLCLLPAATHQAAIPTGPDTGGPSRRSLDGVSLPCRMKGDTRQTRAGSGQGAHMLIKGNPKFAAKE